MKTVVMLGGSSAEREVSLRSGAAVAQALRDGGHEVTELDPRLPGWTLPSATEVVFLALHGTYGEDGTVQSILDELGVAYTGCSAAASRLAFDKVASKRQFVAHGVPTAPFEVFDSAAAEFPEGWSFPVVLKPVRQGSSVGLQFVDAIEQWPAALAAALEHDREVLMERQIRGREVTVGVLGGEALPIVEVRPKSGRYDYERKYTPGQTEYLCPAPIEPEAAHVIQAAALAAFHSIGGRDYGRIDVMLEEDLSPVVLEVNTLPGMTQTSLLPKAAAAAGIGFQDLCNRMLVMAAARRR